MILNNRISNIGSVVSGEKLIESLKCLRLYTLEWIKHLRAWKNAIAKTLLTFRSKWQCKLKWECESLAEEFSHFVRNDNI